MQPEEMLNSDMGDVIDWLESNAHNHVTFQKGIEPDLGVDCVVWCNGEPKIDRLTNKNDGEPWWEESLYCFGDEDRFIDLTIK